MWKYWLDSSYAITSESKIPIVTLFPIKVGEFDATFETCTIALSWIDVKSPILTLLTSPIHYINHNALPFWSRSLSLDRLTSHSCSIPDRRMFSQLHLTNNSRIRSYKRTFFDGWRIACISDDSCGWIYYIIVSNQRTHKPRPSIPTRFAVPITKNLRCST